MRIALAQISATGNKQENLRLIEDQTRYAAQRGANLVVFPEASMQAFDTGRLDINAEDISGAFVGRIKELTDELGIGVAVGMFTPADTVDVEGKSINRVHNTLVVTLPGAENPIFYNKIHTYD
ncbi:amidohydrolase, partial [Salmonella enterica subsp. enterica serovar Typhimurium]|nr:amidohydrolase [Salmonella enterica subsp. enterica serovar Typhimurium]